MPGRFKDLVAMPKLNGYRSLHTTVIGPEGRPLEIQVRTREMHETAELGVAAHWRYKGGAKSAKADEEWLAWVGQLMDTGQDEADPGEFMKSFRTDLFEDEVFVFTPKGSVKTLPAGATPIDFAYAVHTDVGHRTVGAKVNGRIVPLHYRLKSGDRVEILTSKAGRGPSRDWVNLAASSRARNKIRQWYSRESREDTEQKGRETLENALKAQNLPYKKLAGSAVLAQVIRDSGYRKAEDFYLALGSGKLSSGQIVKKVLQRLKTEDATETDPIVLKKPKASTVGSENLGITVKGVEDVLVRIAKCCTPVPGDKILGYISMGKGITIHRADCPNAKALMRNPERFTPVEWDENGSTSFRVQIAVDSWDRPAPARGRGPHLLRARDEHRRLRRHGRGSDGEELVHGRGRRREGPAGAADRAPQPRRCLRRLPRHAVLGIAPGSPSRRRRGSSGRRRERRPRSPR